MMKKLIVLSILSLFVFTLVADAQHWRIRRYEVFLGGGSANIYSDIGTESPTQDWHWLKDFRVIYTRSNATLGVKYKINNRFNARLNLAGAYFTGTDIGTINEDVREGGGYQFTSWIFEPSVMGEFYILAEDRALASEALYNRKGMVNEIFQLHLYVFAGFGGILNYPEVTYVNSGAPFAGDRWPPEGGFNFKRFGMVVPVGIGVKYNLTAYWTLYLELGRRIALTDYVEGYTSKFSSNPDMYDFLTFKASYKLRTSRNGMPILFPKRKGLQ